MEGKQSVLISFIGYMEDVTIATFCIGEISSRYGQLG